MMLSLDEAKAVVNKNLPGGAIQSSVDYNGLYLFMVFRLAPEESEMDPFFSVDKKTGAFKEFSVITDGNTDELLGLFEKAKLQTTNHI